MAQANARKSAAGVTIELLLDEDDVLFARRGPVRAELVESTAYPADATTAENPNVVEVIITLAAPTP